MKTLEKSLWGLALISLGIVLGLDSMNVLNVNLFFNGWWTLFIIVPCAISFCTKDGKIGSLLGLCIGVLMLLGQQEVICPALAYKLIGPVAIIFLGIHVLMRMNGKGKYESTQFRQRAYEGQRDYSVLFSGQNIDMSNQLFQGANLKAMFGGFQLDLRDAVIEEGAVVNIQCLFGGTEIQVSSDINVEISNNSILGGVTTKEHKNPGQGHKTIYLNCSCMFGGVDVKE